MVPRERLELSRTLYSQVFESCASTIPPPGHIVLYVYSPSLMLRGLMVSRLVNENSLVKQPVNIPPPGHTTHYIMGKDKNINDSKLIRIFFQVVILSHQKDKISLLKSYKIYVHQVFEHL